MMKKILILFLGMIFLAGFVLGDDGFTSTYGDVSGNLTCYKSPIGASSPQAYFANVTNPSLTQIIWVYNDTFKTGNCSLISQSDLCCPGGYTCNSSGRCVSGTAPGCGSINNSAECNNASSSVAYTYFNSLSGYAGKCGPANSPTPGFFSSPVNLTCVNVTTCLCEWNTATGKCGGTINPYLVCNGSSPGSYGKCTLTYNSTLDECSSAGKITVLYTATHIGSPGYCNNTQTEYPCSASVQLPFFDSFSLILACLAIIGIYFIVGRKTGKIYKEEDN